MNIISDNKLTGDIINLKVSRKNHIVDNNQKIAKDNNSPAESFAKLFANAVNQTNDLEIKSNELTNQLAINPDSVDIHDVQIASEKAEMGILLTKGIIDRVIRSYRELMNLR
jgi:flagellar hook-basal body complex protein FliE